MFNRRIETFNHLLYLDITTHEHAYLLDSNRQLDYDFSMFNKRFGFVNNFGMKTIFNTLQYLITDIENSHRTERKSASEMVPPNETESLFFRE